VTSSATLNDANACMDAAKAAIPLIALFNEIEKAGITKSISVIALMEDILTVISFYYFLDD
jgi:hypothetical protein